MLSLYISLEALLDLDQGTGTQLLLHIWPRRIGIYVEWLRKKAVRATHFQAKRGRLLRRLDQKYSKVPPPHVTIAKQICTNTAIVGVSLPLLEAAGITESNSQLRNNSKHLNTAFLII